MLPSPIPVFPLPGADWIGLGFARTKQGQAWRGMRDEARDGAERRLSDWMASAQAGDGALYATLLRHCVPVIQAVARSQGVPPGAVDDVVQETLLTLHRVRHTYDPARPFTPWLRAIAARRAIDALRRSGRVGAREVHAPLAYEGHADSGPASDQALQRSQDAHALGAAIATLPPGQREAVEQLGLAERSLAEASAATGRSTGALKVNLHRALHALRARLGAARDGED